MQSCLSGVGFSFCRLISMRMPPHFFSPNHLTRCCTIRFGLHPLRRHLNPWELFVSRGGTDTQRRELLESYSSIHIIVAVPAYPKPEQLVALIDIYSNNAIWSIQYKTMTEWHVDWRRTKWINRPKWCKLRLRRLSGRRLCVAIGHHVIVEPRPSLRSRRSDRWRRVVVSSLVSDKNPV